MKKAFLVLPLLILLSSCNWFKGNNNDTPPVVETPKEAPLAKIPDFNQDSAYAYTKAQVDFGPRILNSPAHEKCAAWMISKLKQWTDTVYVQKYTATAFDGTKMKSTNIIASINPKAATRVFISSHWDTRPIADEDDHDQDKPIDGADDGAGSTAVAMEIARAVHAQRPEIGVDIVLFDSEDYGQPNDSKLPHVEDSWCLGSQYWAKSPHVPGYRADFGINLDMVGTADAVFIREGVSVNAAEWVSQYVWHIASRLGYSGLFVNRIYGQITDDHAYVNQILHIPTIDVIRYDEGGFGKYHHTHKDKMDIISKPMLQNVGKVMLQTIYQYNAEKSNKAS
ncbi:MAG: glutamine cyclotransferase [Bacteroidetes bacterium]|nr:glutamine cyclotransferase [Bacteroidota bacterium]